MCLYLCPEFEDQEKKNTEWDLENLQPSVKLGGSGIVVWGCMGVSGVGEFVFIYGTVDRFVYKGILEQN